MHANEHSITIPLAEFRLLLGRGLHPTIVDVRTAGEYARIHAAGAELMPLDELDPAKLAEQHRISGEAIYVICQSGARAAKGNPAAAGSRSGRCVFH